MSDDSSGSGSGLQRAIASFDRKERRAVIRFLGGEGAVRADWRCARALATALGLQPEEIVCQPWYIDYHWNWLVGALTRLKDPNAESIARHDTTPDLIKNNQEDVDALLVLRTTLILVEAKWDGRWDPGQLRSKARRSAALRHYVEHLQLSEPVSIRSVLIERDRGKPQNDPPILSFADVFGSLPSGLLRVTDLNNKDGPWKIDPAPSWR